MVPSHMIHTFLDLRDLIYHSYYKTRYKTKSTDICTNKMNQTVQKSWVSCFTPRLTSFHHPLLFLRRVWSDLQVNSGYVLEEVVAAAKKEVGFLQK
ncbi:hypothetical protein HanRHA438_Chr04g0153871 [Helianthus annuus]|nr:hypothetical protein HanRHA438_Chr04g0153871 [Helianthus annuus]